MHIVDGKDYIPEVRDLIIEYTKRLGRDLSFQNIDEELYNPAIKYTAPQGALLVAIEHENVVGMVAFQRHSADRCEMKRLYVRPRERGRHIGQQLVEEIMNCARVSGYKEMVLDTIEPLAAARSLYLGLGFTECEPYYHNPMEDVIYMSRKL